LGGLGVPKKQRRLARRHQALRRVGAEGRAGLVEVEGAEHVAVKEAVLAAAPVLFAVPSLLRPSASAMRVASSTSIKFCPSLVV
jgi:hypothetical protein